MICRSSLVPFFLIPLCFLRSYSFRIYSCGGLHRVCTAAGVDSERYCEGEHSLWATFGSEALCSHHQGLSFTPSLFLFYLTFCRCVSSKRTLTCCLLAMRQRLARRASTFRVGRSSVSPWPAQSTPMYANAPNIFVEVTQVVY